MTDRVVIETWVLISNTFTAFLLGAVLSAIVSYIRRRKLFIAHVDKYTQGELYHAYMLIEIKDEQIKELKAKNRKLENRIKNSVALLSGVEG